MARSVPASPRWSRAERNAARQSERLFVIGDRLVEGVILDVNGRDVLEDPDLCARQAWLGRAAELESAFGDTQCPTVLFEVESAGSPVGAFGSEPRVRRRLQDQLGLPKMLQRLVRRRQANKRLADVHPHMRLGRRHQLLLQDLHPQSSRLVEALLQAKGLQLPGARIAR